MMSEFEFMIVRTALALMLGTSAALAAPAAPVVDREALRQHCTGDYLSYCGEFAPDSAEVRACFKQNKAKLSPGCQSAITGYAKAQKRAEIR